MQPGRVGRDPVGAAGCAVGLTEFDRAERVWRLDGASERGLRGWGTQRGRRTLDKRLRCRRLGVGHAGSGLGLGLGLGLLRSGWEEYERRILIAENALGSGVEGRWRSLAQRNERASVQQQAAPQRDRWRDLAQRPGTLHTQV